MPPVIDKKTCVNCGTCVDICPTDVFRKAQSGDVPDVKYPEECWHCNSCVLDCPTKAVSLRIPLSAMVLHIDSPNASK